MGSSIAAEPFVTFAAILSGFLTLERSQLLIATLEHVFGLSAGFGIGLIRRLQIVKD